MLTDGHWARHAPMERTWRERVAVSVTIQKHLALLGIIDISNKRATSLEIMNFVLDSAILPECLHIHQPQIM
jgi:hypothetical protein